MPPGIYEYFDIEAETDLIGVENEYARRGAENTHWTRKKTDSLTQELTRERGEPLDEKQSEKRAEY